MKKLFIAMFFLGAFGQSKSFGQPASTPLPFFDLLSKYYSLKDALFSDDAKKAAAESAELLAAIGKVDQTVLEPAAQAKFIGLRDKLAYDARHISEVSNIDHQREHFAGLSSNMAALAKTVSLSKHPVYEAYCPMKKTYWLSDDAQIQNPYFGSKMPGCGKVVATFKP